MDCTIVAPSNFVAKIGNEIAGSKNGGTKFVLKSRFFLELLMFSSLWFPSLDSFVYIINLYYYTTNMILERGKGGSEVTMMRCEVPERGIYFCNMKRTNITVYATIVV